MPYRSTNGLLALGLTVALCAGLWPADAAAQASRLGSTINIGGLLNTRHPDVAYDPVNDLYLMVGYATPGGVNTPFLRWVNAAGVPLGPSVFRLNSTGAEGARPRAAFGRDQFLVTWYDYRATPKGQVFARFVRFDPASGGAFLGPEFVVGSAMGFLTGESSSPAVAYSSASDEFLVVWRDLGGSPLHDIRGQRVSGDGGLLGGPIAVSFDNHYQAEPAVAYDQASNTFYVAWSNFTEPAGPAGVFGRRVQAGTGALLDATAQVLFTGVAAWIPAVVNNPLEGNFFVGWYTNSPGPIHYGALVSNNGALLKGASPVVVNYPSYDGFGVAHNVLSNTYMAVFHGRSPRPPYEDVAQEILPSGLPSPQGEFEATQTGATVGNYYPQIAATSRAKEWLLVADLNHTTVAGQRLQTGSSQGGGTIPPPPPSPPPSPPPPPPSDPTTINLADAPNGSFFFAEGFASTGGLDFNTYYQLQNPGDQDAQVRAYFARQADDGSAVLKERAYTVKANSRLTIDLRSQVGDGSWSAVFQSMTPGVPVYVQESVFWGQNFEGSSSETGAQTLSPVWLFAEGTRTGGDMFSNWFLFFNPGPQAIDIIGEYFLDGSAAPVTRTYRIGPTSRFTVHVNSTVPELAGRDFSARFRALDGQSGFVAQRAMYWGPNFSPGYASGHTANGVTAAHPTWYFAEGVAAPGFDTYYLLLNPNPFDVQVQVTYLTESGPRARPAGPVTLKANSRGTVHLGVDLGNVGGAGATFSAAGGHGIVVERSVYWGPGWIEGSNDVGVNAPAMKWLLPEGTDANTFDTYILVTNPNPFAVSVRVQFYLEGGGRITPAQPVVIGPQSRLTIDMNAPTQALALSAADAALLAGQSFSAAVTSLTPNGPILVEEAVYRDWVPGAGWRAGASSFGIPQ